VKRVEKERQNVKYKMQKSKGINGIKQLFTFTFDSAPKSQFLPQRHEDTKK